MIFLRFVRESLASRNYCGTLRSGRLFSSTTAEGRTEISSVAAHSPTATKGHLSSRPVSKKEYGFMESAEILFSEREKPRIIGRWDWHAWQLFVSLLPPFGVYCLAMYAQKEMQRMEEEKQTEKEAVWEAELAEEEEKQAPVLLREQQMRERLEALEAIVKDMQTQLERPATDVQPERVPQQSTGAELDEPGLGVNAASTDLNKTSSGWLRWLGLRRGRTPQREDSQATAGPPPDHPEASSQSTSAQPGTSSTTQAASSRDSQPKGQSGVQSTPAAASGRDRRRDLPGTSTADDCDPETGGNEGSSRVLPGDAAGGPAPAAGQHEPAQAGSGGWWPPNLAAWLLPGEGVPAGGPAGGSEQAAGQQKPAQAGSKGGTAWWPLNVTAWLLPGGTAQVDHPSQRAPREASGSSSVCSPAQATQEAGSVESGGGSTNSAEQPPLKARLPTEKFREPSQTPAHRRMSEDHARDAEHYKKWREERRKRAANTEAP
ncbi:g4285 [Coccomyxa elongata]